MTERFVYYCRQYEEDGLRVVRVVELRIVAVETEARVRLEETE